MEADVGRPMLEAVRELVSDGVEPAERRLVRGERTVLPHTVPDRWISGRAPRGVLTSHRSQASIPAPGALDPHSLVVRSVEGRTLRPGVDYAVDDVWGTIGLAEADASPCEVDYAYSLLRIDSVVETATGGLTIVEGQSHLTTPRPPTSSVGARLVATIFVPYFSDGRDVQVLVRRDGPRTVTAPQQHLLAATSARLRAGEEVRIVCWGDSVTAGGDASSDRASYGALVEHGLRTMGADARVTTVAVDGSNSAQWLGRGEKAGCRWSRVAEARPHLVVVEFVNDAELDPETWPGLYLDLKSRTEAIGAELLITTPHFTMASMMRSDHAAVDTDERPYTRFLRDFCRSEQIALADVSRRYEHLALEAVPYHTLLNNGINHPDDRGHALAAEEILACMGRNTPRSEGDES
ncbi:SGNH/GDSL hydrolase family protein [Actinopolymorpha alba]|uniref:SGNH/GDSL hydrolase family protein n=1 Tax=Actinopolymorpha alba TaxID=533267 RepID=UPI0012F6238A|nr:SGNH/GDSL hydrolase family protein [Actinopolymorpha alba]